MTLVHTSSLTRPAASAPGLDRRADRAHFAAHERRHIGAADLDVLDEFHVCGLDHGIDGVIAPVLPRVSTNPSADP